MTDEIPYVDDGMCAGICDPWKFGEPWLSVDIASGRIKRGEHIPLHLKIEGGGRMKSRTEVIAELYEQGLPYSEIAKRTQVVIGTVSYHVTKALRQGLLKAGMRKSEEVFVPKESILVPRDELKSELESEVEDNGELESGIEEQASPSIVINTVPCTSQCFRNVAEKYFKDAERVKAKAERIQAAADIVLAIEELLVGDGQEVIQKLWEKVG